MNVLPVQSVEPLKRAFVFVAILLIVVLVIEVIGLVVLKSQVSRYKNFWQKKAQQDGEIVYVALGDSAAQGIGATSPMRGYVGLIAKHIQAQTGKTVKTVNLSVTASTVADALRDQIPQLKNYQPDVVTVELGSNNVKDLEEQKFRKQFAELVAAVPSGSFIADVPDFGGGPLLQNARQAAKIAREEIAKRPDLNLIPLEQHTIDNFNHLFDYAPDFFHPDNSGYRVWAEAFKKCNISKI